MLQPVAAYLLPHNAVIQNCRGRNTTSSPPPWLPLLLSFSGDPHPPVLIARGLSARRTEYIVEGCADACLAQGRTLQPTRCVGPDVSAANVLPASHVQKIVSTMAEHLPVVAVIPNDNMGDNLGKLLPEVLAQRYDCVFVLDDASTDHSLDVIRGFNDEVKLVRSPENRGAGANRNHIIDHIADGVLIHFIDADMDLATAEIPAVAREVVGRYADRGVGLVGGLIRQLDGGQFPYNYGAVFLFWEILHRIFPG